MQNAGLDEAHAGIKTAWRNINNLRYADETTLMEESEEEQRNPLMKVKEEMKRWLKTQHSKNEDPGTRSHHFIMNRNNETLFSCSIILVYILLIYIQSIKFTVIFLNLY